MDGGVANTLIREPPKKQVCVGPEGARALDWEPAADVTTAQLLFSAVRRVRNNLLHGGKAGDPDGERNDALIANSIAVLVAALGEKDELRWEFEGRY